MQKFIWLVLAFAALNTGAALAKGDSCEAQIKGNTEYAQWGRQLRSEMLNECGKQPANSCQIKYEKKIDAIDKKNSAAVEKAFPNPSVDDPAFIEVVSRNLALKMSAMHALTGGGSAKQVADLQYRLCKGLPLLDPEPRRSSRPMPPIPPPMMPIEPSITSRLTPIQPDMGGAVVVPSCTNYNYLGPNGRAVYCQQCCSGDGNCQLLCN